MDLLPRLLEHYGLDQEGYAALVRTPSFSNLPDIQDNPEVQVAVALVQEAIAQKKKILVYGDYDCDGVMATSITVSALRKKGADVRGYLPSRYIDGYGATLANVQKIVEAGYGLLILVDNGVSAHEALAYAKEKGIPTIVIDHHEIVGEAASHSSLIHPDTLSLHGPEVSAGFLSFLFSRVLLGEDDHYLAVLGALSTLSDMMPLINYNREIVRLALLFLEEENFPQINDFLGGRIDEKRLQMELIPAINAVGRLEKDSSINRLLSYFTEADKGKIAGIATWMKEINKTRKQLTKDAELSLNIPLDEAAIVLVSDLPEGLNGLLANRLLTEYAKPVCVLSRSEKEEGVLVGSLRSQEGFNVMKALENLKPFLLAGGGHAFAGGLSIKESDFAAFKKAFLFDALKFQINPPKKDYVPLVLEEATMENYQQIRRFAPFGQQWKEPTFLLSRIPSSGFNFVKDGKYLSTRLPGGARLFSFSLGSSYFADKEAVDLAAHFALNEYQGRVSLDLLVEKP